MEFYFSKSFVLFGDKTTHDGEIISASSTMIVNGKTVALVSDEVNCPVEGHGVNVGKDHEKYILHTKNVHFSLS